MAFLQMIAAFAAVFVIGFFVQLIPTSEQRAQRRRDRAAGYDELSVLPELPEPPPPAEPKLPYSSSSL